MINPKTNQRELVYVTHIVNITPLEGYDRVEYAQIGDGWKCVVKKGDFQIGDLAVYFEIDSKLPETEVFEFCAKYKYRVKTQRLCHVLSQGLVMHPRDLGLTNVKEGDFLTEKLKVTYYEPEDNARKADINKYTSMQARHKKFFKTKFAKWFMKREWGRKLMFFFFGKKKDKKIDWPSWVIKTDEERCLAADTKVETDQGLIRIGDIVTKKLPVKVKSFNHLTNRIEYKDIIDYQHYTPEKELIKITVPFCVNATRRTRSFLCTSDHKFYTPDGYIKARDLNVGQTVYTSSYGNISEERILPIKIKEITKVKCKKHVYDIEVKDNHNFFAGGILNHNCQNCFSARKALNKKWIATEKIDGTSTTFTMRQAKPRKRKMLVCSRNIVYDTPKKEEKNFYKDTDGNVYLEMASKYGIEKILNYMLTTAPDLEYVTIQGETYGGTIQKRNYGPEHRLAIFNIIGKFKGEAPIRLNPIKMVECIESLNEECGANLESVPSLGYLELPETCDELLALAGGKSLIDGQPREGIVLRSEDGVDSFKAVDNGYLEKYHG